MRFFTPALALSFLLVSSLAFGQLQLPDLFSSHMVLQRQKPVPVWGWAKPGDAITVTMNGQSQRAKTDKAGRWEVRLSPMEAGGPHTMTVAGKSGTATLDDVLVGDVWLCSGQSNMEWPVKQTKNAAAEMAAATYPQIRQFYVPHLTSPVPLSTVPGQWSVCSPQTVGAFTAVGYFFARDLQKDLNVPIGLVHSSWGGTHSETWTSREAIESDPALRPSLARMTPDNLQNATKRRQARLDSLIRQKQGTMPSATDAATFRLTALNTSAWPTMAVPGPIEKQLPELDGVFWVRKVVDVPATANLDGVSLSLGPIDDIDSTFVNGQLVGTLRTYSEPRRYKLPAGTLQPGRNVIAIRVEDEQGGGGLVATESDLLLSGPGWSLPLAGEWQYMVTQPKSLAGRKDPNAYPTLLYNAMLKPLVPYAIKGAIWYQGESNAGRAVQYRTSFPLMISDWRTQWGEAFPFLFVQLANFNANGGNSQTGSGWAELREAQTMTLSLPNTGMAVTADIGEPNDIHPRNKQDVGKRLAAEARRVAYGQPGTSSGPMFNKLTVTGIRAELSFTNTGGGLMTPDKYGYLYGFEVAGEDQQFHYAKAVIVGNSVMVYADSVAKPVAVRYGWADDNGEVNLYNKEGFPAVPFRTDTWKARTEGQTFR